MKSGGEVSRLPERDTRARAPARPLQVAAEQRRDRDHLHPHLHVGPYLAFTGHVPFTSYGYELNATFANSANIAINSPVRIAGVDVGKVISTERDGDATTVTFTVERRRPADPRRRLRRDPAADLPRGQLLRRPRPRQPQRAGARQRRHDPGQPHLDRGPDRRGPDGAAVARPRRPQPPAGELRHGADPRADRGRRHRPVAGGAGQDRRPKAFNGAFKYGGDAGRYSAQVTNALLGTQQRDLSRLVAGAGRTFGALASHEADLQGLIDNFNIFTGALAAQSANLSTTIALALRPCAPPAPRWSASTGRCRRCAPTRSS